MSLHAFPKANWKPFSFNLVIRDSDYEREGETKVYVGQDDSGQAVHLHFCGKCGSLVFEKIGPASGKVILKAGALDSMRELESEPGTGQTEGYSAMKHSHHLIRWSAQHQIETATPDYAAAEPRKAG
jgi:hypothetical protein